MTTAQIERSDLTASLRRDCRRAFGENELRSSDSSGSGLGAIQSWLMQRGTSSCYLVQVAILLNHRLLVHGDCANVLLACPPEDPMSVLRWFADSHLDYLEQKIILQPGPRHNRDVALKQLEDLAGDVVDIEDLEVITDARNALEEGDDVLFVGMHLARELAHKCDLSSFIRDFGKDINTPLIWAQEAVRKLLELLEKQKEDDSKIIERGHDT